MTEEDGNTQQNMRIAETIADTVLERYAKRHPGKTPSDHLMQWLPLIIAAATAFWSFAIQSKQVEQNSADIVKLEARYDQTQAIMQSVDSRLARIETTLDIVTGGKVPNRVGGR